MTHHIMEQSPRVSITKAPRVGYRTVHLVLNCICLATAALETYVFYWGSMFAYFNLRDQSSRSYVQDQSENEWEPADAYSQDQSSRSYVKDQSENAWDPTDAYLNIINPGKSIRIAYLLIVTGLTIASAVIHGIGNASRPNKSPAIKRVHEMIYYSLSAGSLVILSIVHLARFFGGMESIGYHIPYLMTVIVLTFIDAMVYLAAASSAWLSRSEY